jgi:TPR repeat protein
LLRSQTNEAGAPSEGLRYLERGCALGSADACYEIGEIETSEIALAGVPRETWPPTDPADALRHYERACALGDDRGCQAPAGHFGASPEQARMMCESHEQDCSHGVPQIQQPPSGASCRIAAWCYETGRGGKKDAARACALDRRGCKLKNPGACAAAKACR